MVVEGVYENGSVKLDGGPSFKNGQRVGVYDLSDTPAPKPPHDEAELQILREAIAEGLAGKSEPFLEVMAGISARLGLPPLGPDERWDERP